MKNAIFNKYLSAIMQLNQKLASYPFSVLSMILSLVQGVDSGVFAGNELFVSSNMKLCDGDIVRTAI
jgi:hypothetical protein